MLSASKKKGRANDMEKYATKQDGRARTISTLGGDYALKWDCEAADVRYLFKARRTKGVRGTSCPPAAGAATARTPSTR